STGRTGPGSLHNHPQPVRPFSCHGPTRADRSAPQLVRVLAAGAALATIALTAAAFWLSYEHLHDIAATHGLGHAPERAWAWPATVDLFIVAGELLTLRASLRGVVDRWAVALAASGSLGSIALKAGVGPQAHPLNYVVAAVPPVAALLAFGALMRQVHDALARASETAVSVTAPTGGQPGEHHVEVTAAPPAEVTARPHIDRPVADTAPQRKALVICGDRRVFLLPAPRTGVDAEVTAEQVQRLSADAARVVLESCWSRGTPSAEAARLATRSTS
ncbi:DUF2637 domain-containing protein, partial [Streptomyces erythrochromogenes]|uniref:DUF2637 domain-containing protein n=1 Tax=Streptomyces erythrochromogenes TaxID=285574 RepID=UPI0036B721A7